MPTVRFESPEVTCSLTSSLGELSRATKIGTAPLSITTLVWSEVPDATFVSAHAASNCQQGTLSFHSFPRLGHDFQRYIRLGR